MAESAVDAEERRKSLYERDVYAWAHEQARLLRERRFDDLDLENLIEEVEGVGSSNKRRSRAVSSSCCSTS